MIEIVLTHPWLSIGVLVVLVALFLLSRPKVKSNGRNRERSEFDRRHVTRPMPDRRANPPPPDRMSIGILHKNEDFIAVYERFPHIGKKLTDLWGGDGFSLFINKLLIDTKDGARQGFPDDIAFRLFRLANLQDDKPPQTVHQSTDIWDLQEDGRKHS